MYQHGLDKIYCAFANKWRAVFKSISTPLFLEDENIFQKSARVVQIPLQFRSVPCEPIFEKCSHRFLKKLACWFFPLVCMVGCMARIFHTNLKIRMMISGLVTSRNYIKLLVPGQIWDHIRDPKQILARYDLQNFRKRIFELRQGRVKQRHSTSTRIYSCIAIAVPKINTTFSTLPGYSTVDQLYAH